MPRWTSTLAAFALFAVLAPADDLFPPGEGIDLDEAIPANERGILSLAEGKDGRIYGGTTGRAAHLFAYDPMKAKVESLVRLPGGIGLAYQLVALPDGSFLTGTQADPTGTAVKTDPKEVGKLLQVIVAPGKPAVVRELGLPVPGQGIYTLAFDETSQTLVGNTWPDGHFFSYSLKTKKMQDHGPLAGYRTFETPAHAKDLNRHTKDEIRYPRQVSKAILIVPGLGAITAGADGFLHQFDFVAGKVTKLKTQLPAMPGRESWCSIDAAIVFPSRGEDDPTHVLGGTSDGYLFELRFYGKDKIELRNRGRAFSQPRLAALAFGPSRDKDKRGQTIMGIAGPASAVPRWVALSRGAKTSSVIPGPVPLVDGVNSMSTFGAMCNASDGSLYAGESDRIGRLIRYRPASLISPKKPKPAPPREEKKEAPEPEKLTPLPGWVVFAPPGTTTDGSGYTAINIGKDGKVYVGAARYGGYAWLLRFNPETKSYFMEKVVNMRQITGENLSGICTQGKIHAIIIIGPDGRIWFATKQAHEVFGTRPEYGEGEESYPGGHLCYFDPKTGFSKSVGILKRHEGLMGGAMDKKRNKLYYRSEPRNYFLVYDVETGKVEDRGHQGANCRYMAIDKDGAVYSPGRGAYLSRYDPETGYLEELKVKLEGPGHYAAPYVIQMGPNGKLYGAGTNHPWIIEYDVDKLKSGMFPEVTARNVAPAAPKGIPIHDIHAGIFGKDGRFYYPLNTMALGLSGKVEKQLRIMRFDPATKKVETVGIPDLSSLDESKVKHAYVREGAKYEMYYTQGMTVGEDGSLYVMCIYPQLNVVCFPKLTAPR